MLGEISSDDACLELTPKALNGRAICVMHVVYVPYVRVSWAPTVELQALAAFTGISV